MKNFISCFYNHLLIIEKYFQNICYDHNLSTFYELALSDKVFILASG